MIAKSVIVNRSFIALCAGVLFSTPFGASAQVSDVEPYLAVITRDATPMRCGDMDRFYKVAEIDAGKVVKVVGESRAWARVEYPSGHTAFVRADEGTSEGSVVVLSVETKLRAANLAGPSGSWKPLLGERLETGTRLELIENVTARDGSVFYRVAAPDGAHGYIQLASLRKASDDEIATHLGAGGAAIATADPVDAGPAAEGTPELEPADEPRVVVDESVDQESALSSDEQVEPALVTGDGDTATDTEQPVATIEQEPAERPLMTYEELEQAFGDVLSEDIEHAEIEELVAEYNRVIESIEDTELNQSLRERLGRRVSMLTLRADYQQSLRDLDERSASVSADRAELEEHVARLRNESEFSFVGRLSASKIYDGRRMPLLFRLESVGEAPRTLGYLRPDEKEQMSNKLGLLVGIIGSSNQDATSDLLIIEPQRIVVIDQESPIEN